jgi:sugar O-acyltransferase (sialic acid O-acetyltransferase NeuD family)
MLHLIGSGGHASVVADAARRAGETEVTIWSDAGADATRFAPGTRFARLADLPIDTPVVLAFGDLAARRAMRESHPHAPAAIVHPSVIVGFGAQLGEGAVLFAGAIVNANANVGRDAIINTGCIVEHDCQVGDNAHLSPGVRLSGTVTIGADAHLGTGAIVLPNLRVGRGAVVGAGAVVIRDVADGAVVAGVPARALRAK